MNHKIAFYDELYSAGGFYEPVITREDLQHIDVTGNNQVRLLQQTYPRSAYERSPASIQTGDPDFKEALESIFAAIKSSYPVASSALALEIKDCSLCDSVIYLSDGARLEPFYPTYRSNDQPYVQSPAAGSLARAWHETERRLFYLASAGSFNYGHWLVDDLPRLKFLLDYREATTVLMQSYGRMDDIRRQYISMLTKGLDVDVQFLAKEDIVECKAVTYVTPVSFHPYIKNKFAMDFIRDHFRARRSWRRPAERVFVVRRPGRGRMLTNTQDIQKLLKKYGFSFVDPEELSAEQQVTIFSDAKIVVGTMCAAMCNIVFAKPGIDTVFLAPTGWAEPFYWDLANALGQNYKSLYGERAMAASDAHFDDFAIDPSVLEQTLRELIQK